MVAAIACPNDDDLTRFVRMQLPEPASDRIRDHLDVCDPCRLGIVAGLSRRHTEPITHFDRELAIGMRLGHFEIVRKLGAGGMGVVYEAVDERLGRAVALKLVHGRSADGDAQLLGEARAMAKIRHAAVLTVYEAGEHDGAVYLATELIRGATLREYVERTKPARAELVALYRRAAEGLAAAHAHGLVHRDFKPDNVLVEGEPAERVLVADFGLATAMRGADDQGSTPAGTPAYMAPEQMDGEPLDARVDVFAFCVSLWEALTGGRPYPGVTIDQLRAAMADPPRPPPRLPKRLAAVLVRGVDPERDRRPTLDELLAVLAPPRRRHRLVIAIAAVAVAAVATLAAASRHGGEDLGAACRGAPTPNRVTSGWREHAVAPAWVIARVSDRLAARDREVVALQPAACKQSDDVRRAWIACRHDQAIAEAALGRAFATAWPSYDHLDEALDLPWVSTCMSRAAQLDVVLEPATADARVELDRDRRKLADGRFAALAGHTWSVDLPADGPLEAERLLDEGTLRTDLGSAERLATLERAVELAERRGHLMTAASGWLHLAIARGEARLDASSIDLAFSQANWSIDRAGDPPMLRASWHAASASRAWQRTDLAGAAEHARAAQTLAGDDPYRQQLATRALISAAAARADFAGERALFETLLPHVNASHGIEAAHLHSIYSEALYHLGDLDHAMAEAELALSIAREAVGDRDPETAEALIGRGFIELDQGHLDLCEAHIGEALDVLYATVGGTNPAVGTALNLRASVREGRQDWKGALADNLAAAEIFERKLGPRAEELIFSRTHAGSSAESLGRTDQAEALLTTALDDARATYGAEDPRTADVERALADVLVDRHQRGKAIALLEHAVAATAKAGGAVTYAAQGLAQLSHLVPDRVRAIALADQALAAWRNEPAWQAEYAEMTRWRAKLATSSSARTSR